MQCPHSTICESSDSMPPDRTIVLPPSPPPSDEKLSPAVFTVVRLLQSHRDGTLYSGSWIKCRLLLTEYRKVWELLEKDNGLNGLGGYVEDKVRYDFNPDNEEFIIRMPTPTHELFIENVVDDMKAQFRDAASGQGLDAEKAKQIICHGGTDIILRDEPGRPDDNSDWDLKMNAKYPKRTPDTAFGPATVLYPTVVLEISYSQKRKDLRYIADDYIIGSGGSIGVVIGLDVEYRKKTSKRTSSKMATVSMWRRKIWMGEDGMRHLEAEEVISEDVFRTANGEAALGALTLKLSDFFLPDVTSSSDQSVSISIPYSRLATYLNLAQERQILIDNECGPKLLETKQERQSTIGHKHKQSPVEEFDSADDVQIEERISQRAKRVKDEDRIWLDGGNKSSQDKRGRGGSKRSQGCNYQEWARKKSEESRAD
ncbi:hypothetical protein GP486_005847 [Trichoglossum hirsutum]|uniref:Uncharacterized protein n=1 Tax=Trichoglossum hirsutum TaxID=265104 RepID=A0A9P8L8F3_9PEZI|nr:hypothetical protein GP486_005847 [Trichoglossum hirsutum]